MTCIRSDSTAAPSRPGRRHLGSLVAAAGVLAAGPASAHEAWLLTPSEVAALSKMPLPELFTSTWPLALAAAVGGLVAVAALRIEDRLRPLEERLLAPLAALAPAFGPLAIRLGLAIMLALAALGGLPRSGVARWTQPTLFVPDMQLALAPGWVWLAAAELTLAAVLLLGLATRLAGIALGVLALLGIAAFGTAFVPYAAHFLAPGLMLAVCGSGACALDRLAKPSAWPGLRLAQATWSAALALLGGGFVYLAITVKLFQPTLMMAILDHGQVPRFGLPLAVAALVTMGVELIVGALLAMGRLTRPIALFLIGAFTFFAFTISETPLFHANLYGVMVMLLLSGCVLPARLAARPERGPALA